MYDSRIRILMSYLAFLQEHLNHVPEGFIIYEKYRYRWFLPDGSHHRLYLEKDEQIIRELCCKRYWKHAMVAAKAELSACQSYERHAPKQTPEQVWANLPLEIRRFVSPLQPESMEQIEKWKRKAYRTTSNNECGKIYCCSDGTMVRSKSEYIIAEKLISYQIPFRYECGAYLRHYGWVYPDFIMLRASDFREIVYEHFGRMDDPTYLSHAVKKIMQYQENGYLPWKNFVYTVESSSSPLRPETVDEMIHSVFEGG